MDVFRKLSVSEEAEFRKWARENYRLGEPISGIWHPAVQDECAKMNAGAKLDVRTGDLVAGS